MDDQKPIDTETYIAQFPVEIQQRLLLIFDIFNKVCPGVETSIRYGMPAFKVGKEHLYVAAYKKHIGIYPMYGLNDLENELSIYRGKGTKDALHLPHNKPLPLDLIEMIIVKKSR